MNLTSLHEIASSHGFKYSAVFYVGKYEWLLTFTQVPESYTNFIEIECNSMLDVKIVMLRKMQDEVSERSETFYPYVVNTDLKNLEDELVKALALSQQELGDYLRAVNPNEVTYNITNHRHRPLPKIVCSNMYTAKRRTKENAQEISSTDDGGEEENTR